MTARSIQQTFCSYQFVLTMVKLCVGLVADDQLLHELEVLGAELGLVVHELNVLFAHTALHRRRHLHLTRPVLCTQTDYVTTCNTYNTRTPARAPPTSAPSSLSAQRATQHDVPMVRSCMLLVNSLMRCSSSASMRSYSRM